ncbi:hypothetical protein N806_17245 [Rhodococcus sp. P27]|nr:hypothetical protein N806_17245 [Rhodococcus sp. P27]GCB56239.1 hypothetical protein rerp_26470 [Rhodococcus erythropolis]
MDFGVEDLGAVVVLGAAEPLSVAPAVAGAESGTGAPWTDPEQPASSATAATAAREHAATRLDDRGHTRM